MRILSLVHVFHIKYHEKFKSITNIRKSNSYALRPPLYLSFQYNQPSVSDLVHESLLIM